MLFQSCMLWLGTCFMLAAAQFHWTSQMHCRKIPLCSPDGTLGHLALWYPIFQCTCSELWDDWKSCFPVSPVSLSPLCLLPNNWKILQVMCFDYCFLLLVFLSPRSRKKSLWKKQYDETQMAFLNLLIYIKKKSVPVFSNGSFWGGIFWLDNVSTGLYFLWEDDYCEKDRKEFIVIFFFSFLFTLLIHHSTAEHKAVRSLLIM